LRRDRYYLFLDEDDFFKYEVKTSFSPQGEIKRGELKYKILEIFKDFVTLLNPPFREEEI
jgi:hypothetical protein